MKLNIQAKKDSWKYHEPVFECDVHNPYLLEYSPWAGHRRFVYDLVLNFRPNKVVELGSFYGASSFTFAQSIKDGNIKCALSCIDIWDKFDVFTLSDYESDVYGRFMTVLKACYDTECIQVLKMKFDDARYLFDKGSIDLLHIDGAHDYESVKHDFELWFDGMCMNGIILFHDISSDPGNGDVMGSHIFWKELKEKYHYTFEFPFSFGLGILCLSRLAYESLKKVDFSFYQKKFLFSESKTKDLVRRFSFLINSLKSEKKGMQKAYEKTISEKDIYIRELEGRMKD